MKVGSGAIHPDAAETRPAERQRAVAVPARGVATRAMKTEVNVRRALPAPLAQERSEPVRQDGLEGVRHERAVEIQTEVVRRIEKVGGELTTAMPQTDIAQHGARAVPGEIEICAFEVDVTIGEFFDRKFARHFEFLFSRGDRGRAGRFELRGRMERDLVQHRAEAKAV